jgi:hypothetical protein
MSQTLQRLGFWLLRLVLRINLGRWLVKELILKAQTISARGVARIILGLFGVKYIKQYQLSPSQISDALPLLSAKLAGTTPMYADAAQEELIEGLAVLADPLMTDQGFPVNATEMAPTLAALSTRISEMDANGDFEPATP